MCKIINISEKNYDEGSYARPPSNYRIVTFSDGEKVEVRVDNGCPVALGFCYWDGESKSKWGRMAEKACENFSLDY